MTIIQNIDNSRHSSINGGNFFGNTNVQSDGNLQLAALHPDHEALIKAIHEAIAKGCSDHGEREDASENAAKLTQALRERDTTRAKRIFAWLPQAVQVATAVAGLAQKLGLHP